MGMFRRVLRFGFQWWRHYSELCRDVPVMVWLTAADQTSFGLASCLPNPYVLTVRRSRTLEGTLS